MNFDARGQACPRCPLPVPKCVPAVPPEKIFFAHLPGTGTPALAGDRDRPLTGSCPRCPRRAYGFVSPPSPACPRTCPRCPRVRLGIAQLDDGQVAAKPQTRCRRSQPARSRRAANFPEGCRRQSPALLGVFPRRVLTLQRFVGPCVSDAPMPSPPVSEPYFGRRVTASVTALPSGCPSATLLVGQRPPLSCNARKRPFPRYIPDLGVGAPAWKGSGLFLCGRASPEPSLRRER